MATIKDIAEACHVSKATVSRYINNSGYVSQEAAEAIAEKIRELDYVPSATARNLTTRKSNVIGVVIPEVNNPFFAEIFKGISQEAEQHELSIFYCDTDNSAEKELKALDMLRRYEIEGLILTPATGGLYEHKYNEEFVNAVTSLKVPVVLLDRDVQYKEWDGVFIDNFKGAYEAVRCLIEAGHRRIGTITGNMELMIGRERFRGYKEALEDGGLKVEASHVLEGDFTTETAYRKMNEMLSAHPEVTAVFSPNNLTTMGVLKAVYEKKLKIPQDMAFAGFDDIELLKTLNINLTVASRDTNQMGREAMKLLFERISNEGASGGVKRIVLNPEIIKRGSEG
ncbi:MAG: LacI family DNA-binding transcriptional regulator [Spirochaetales bacterium]|nr:LacI family DNA-binding transcriptional regulator [Spirochaetales bacterium]